MIWIVLKTNEKRDHHRKMSDRHHDFETMFNQTDLK